MNSSYSIHRYVLKIIQKTAESLNSLTNEILCIQAKKNRKEKFSNRLVTYLIILANKNHNKNSINQVNLQPTGKGLTPFRLTIYLKKKTNNKCDGIFSL